MSKIRHNGALSMHFITHYAKCVFQTSRTILVDFGHNLGTIYAYCFAHQIILFLGWRKFVGYINFELTFPKIYNLTRLHRNVMIPSNDPSYIFSLSISVNRIILSWCFCFSNYQIYILNFSKIDKLLRLYQNLMISSNFPSYILFYAFQWIE